MNLNIFNTLSKKLESFKPLGDTVKVYGCGPTVYNHPHIGNARPAVVGDILVRILRNLFKKVVYVRNITDIDDKINKKAKEENVTIEVIALKYTKIYQENMRTLNVLPPDIEPTVTQNIHSVIKMISTLLEKKNAYEAENHILFHVPSFKNYGDLSKRKKDEMMEGARVEVAPYKKDPMDFVLWKPSKEDQVGWESPWGRGRPGWHIECSSMIETYLGETIDIHLGGNDLIFPHHENEIAQSNCAHNGKPLSKYWMHNGFISMDKEKMSKSVGNIILINDILKKYTGETVRLAMLSAHYKQPLNWNEKILIQANKNLENLYDIIGDDKNYKFVPPPKKFFNALLNDLNTPEALKELYELSKDKNNKDQLKSAANYLGILQLTKTEWINQKKKIKNIDEKKIDKLIHDRDKARKEKKFDEADKIRNELALDGIILEDSPTGTKWRINN
ncbi:MAG: Cysteine--tRNA ligase [Alphaproteobacteria bacterium MarineAlpha6_Bin3]|nr:MAG: Cysteine--tRNA ligase [Alphaproteobacteria bacterium MarineAlpha6_Bin3]